LKGGPLLFGFLDDAVHRASVVDHFESRLLPAAMVPLRSALPVGVNFRRGVRI